MINMPPFYTMEMMRFAAEVEAKGQEVFHLEVGQSTVTTPNCVVDEAIILLRENKLNYCSALGVFQLREAISRHYKYKYNLDVDPNCIVITPGTSLALYCALLMNFKKGARIAIASPSYPCYRNVIKSLGFILVEVCTTKQNNYLITPESLMELVVNVDGVLMASPNNPTGSMYDEAGLKAITEYCANNKIHLISDEIYHGITYEIQAQTAYKFDKNCTVINGFSKYFAMTGWRVGWMIVPKNDVARYESLLQNLILCTSPLNQMAAAKAFDAYDELDRHVQVYKNNRNILYNSLVEAGLSNIFKPLGGFYIYLELDDININSMDFCRRLLYEEGVAVAPGLDFISDPKHCSIRLSFCQSEDVVVNGAAKLNRFIKRL